MTRTGLLLSAAVLAALTLGVALVAQPAQSEFQAMPGKEGEAIANTFSIDCPISVTRAYSRCT